MTIKVQLDKLEFQFQREAELVIEFLRECIDQYGYVSMSDLKDMSGLPTYYLDNNWGWLTIEGFSASDGTLSIPDTVELVGPQFAGQEARQAEKTVSQLNYAKILLGKIAKNMKDDGLPNIQIAKYLELDEPQVLALFQE